MANAYLKTQMRFCNNPEKENNGADCQETLGSSVSFINGTFGPVKVETQTRACTCDVGMEIICENIIDDDWKGGMWRYLDVGSIDKKRQHAWRQRDGQDEEKYRETKRHMI